MKIQLQNAAKFLRVAKEFNYMPNRIRRVDLTPTMVAVGVVYLEHDLYGYLEFNHDGRFGLMLSRVQTISEAERDDSFYFKSFEPNDENFRRSLVRIYEHLNA